MIFCDYGKWKSEFLKSAAGRWGVIDPGHVDPSDFQALLRPGVI